MIDYSARNIYVNSMLSVIYKIFSMGTSFITVPLILHCLGTEKYGVWASVLSLISWIYYLDLGIGGGLRNKLAESLAQRDIIKANGYLNTAYFMLGILCIVIIIIMASILCFYDVKQWLNYSTYDENINLVVLTALAFACVNFVAALVNNIFYATQQASQVSLYNLLGQIFFAMGLVGYLFLGIHELLWISILEGISQFLKNAIETFCALKKFPLLRFSIANISTKYSRGVIVFGAQLFIMQIAALTLNCTDNLIIAKYFGAADVTVYSLCFKYFGMIQAFFVVLITPLYSAYTAAYTKRDIKKIQHMLWESLCIYTLFIGGTIAGIVIFPWFLRIWLHMEINVPYSLTLLVAIYFMLLMFTHCFSMFINGIGKIRETIVVVMAEAIINVPLSIYLAVRCDMGIDGVILGSIGVVSIAAIAYPYIALKMLREMR